MTRNSVVSRLRAISPGWWGAAAGAAGAGAAVFPAHRIVAAFVGAGAVIALAWSRASCACSSEDAGRVPYAEPELAATPGEVKSETWQDDYGLATVPRTSGGAQP